MVEVRCTHCGRLHRVPRDIFGHKEKVELACPACGKKFQVVSPKVGKVRPGTTHRKISPITAEVSPEGHVLRLPLNQEINLRVLEGEEKGTVFRVDKARITIGRANADVTIPDEVASRVHCSLEVSDEGVVLRDLGSTNGTLVNGKPIQTAPLSNGAKFRVGTHTFELRIAPKA